MKTIEEQIAVMQHFAAGGKIELQCREDGSWMKTDYPYWDWRTYDYRIEEVDPYAELKEIAKDQTKQIRLRDCMGEGKHSDWQDVGYGWRWKFPAEDYEIRDKPKPMKKVKLLAWFDGVCLYWRVEWQGFVADFCKRVPAEDKEIEVEQ